MRISETLLIRILSILILLGTVTDIYAAHDLTKARADMKIFRDQASVGQPGSSAYQSLLEAAREYMLALEGEPIGSPVYEECRNTLLEIFPHLAEGAYFYAGLSDQSSVLTFASAFADVSLLPCMGNENLWNFPSYSTLTNLAATNLYNRRQYDKAIAYFQAYLENGDPSCREQAFEGLARAFYEKNAYGNAANICYQASKEYPANRNILFIGIEAAGKNGNDKEMGEMLEMALRIEPNHAALLEYQGKLFERQRKYEEAARSYEKLMGLPGTTLDHITHLGFDYYNAATLEYTRAKGSGDETGIANAIALFDKAAPNLQTVLANTPYAANVARALAFCYSMTNNATRLEEANRVLASLNSQKVDFGALPTIEKNYTPSAVVSYDALAMTQDMAAGKDEKLISDVDIDLPSTGLSSPDTIALIIANENYTNRLSNVDFALRDGEVFKEYCIKILGIPEKQIKYYPDATFVNMKSAIGDLKGLTDAKPDKLNLIVYYAGHGAPDEIGESSYLLPIDSNGRDKEFMINLNKMYDELNDMQARNITVFLDACFSGQGRNGQSLIAGRFVAKDASDMKPRGKSVIFSAGNGQQIANPCKEQGHGYFTYYLLKALKDSRGSITLSDLGRKLREEVTFAVRNDLSAEQTPETKASPELGNSWETRTLAE